MPVFYQDTWMVQDEVSKVIEQKVPTLVARDFNYIDSTQEKSGGSFTNGIEAWEFQEFTSENGLVDLDFFDPRFTWCNNQQDGARVWECIDRIFASDQWMDLFLKATVSHPT